jgi:hypothetical protein
VQDQEGQPEHGKGVLGPQFAVFGVDVELLGEAADRQRGEVPAGRVDVGEVVAGLGARAGRQRLTVTSARPQAERGSGPG